MFASCSKYEDGPWISFRSVDKRIGGSWHVYYFKVNDIDKTDYWISNYNWSFRFYTYSDFPEETSKMFRMYDIVFPDNCVPDTVGIQYGYGRWNMEDDDLGFGFSFLTDSGITITDTCGLFPVLSATYIEWKVRRLKSNDFWLELKESNGSTLIKLRKY